MTYSVKNILWATDFSAEATNALAYAALFAKTCRAGLSAIHVQPELEPALLESRPALLKDIYKQAGVNLGKARKRKARPGIRKILVPTDFSEREEIERDFAWSLASTFKADLTLLHALVLHDYRVAPEFAESMLRDVLERLKKRKARGKKGFQVHEDVVWAMSVAGGIVSYAEANKFDLIAISTTTHSKLARFFLGSNTERVISYAEVPVFAIPAGCSDE